MSAVVGIKELEAACKRAAKALNVSVAARLNRAAMRVAMHARYDTKAASAAQITAKLTDQRKYALKIAVRALKKRVGTPVMKKGQPFVYKRTGKVKLHGPITREQIAKKAKAIIGSRRGRAQAIRVGWIPAIEKFGGDPGNAKGRKVGSSIAGGGGKLATENNLNAEVWNALITKDRKRNPTDVKDIPYAVHGLNEAIAKETANVISYTAQQLDEKAVKSQLVKFT